MNLDERFDKIVEINGKNFQFEIAVEEASEFIQAVQKLKRGKGTLQQVLGEMADVLVTFSCLRKALKKHGLYTDIDSFITQVMLQKTDWVEAHQEPTKDPVTWQDYKE